MRGILILFLLSYFSQPLSLLSLSHFHEVISSFPTALTHTSESIRSKIIPLNAHTFKRTREILTPQQVLLKGAVIQLKVTFINIWDGFEIGEGRKEEVREGMGGSIDRGEVEGKGRKGNGGKNGEISRKVEGREEKE